MRTEFMLSLMIAGVLLFSSCGKQGKPEVDRIVSAHNSVEQQTDGTISLNLEKAAFYSDASDPSYNTAEWSVLLTKSGRFDVWLSSATRDTNDLKYEKMVMLSIHDKRLEAMPSCDRIITDSEDVSLPFFRAESFIGSLYLQDTGRLNVQVISDRIIPAGYKPEGSSAETDTKLLSIVLTPSVR